MGGFSRNRATRQTRKPRGGLWGAGFTGKADSKPVTQKKARKLQRRKKNKLVRERKNRRTIQPLPPSRQDRQLDKWQTPPFDPRLPARF